MKKLLMMFLAALALYAAPQLKAWNYQDGDVLLVFRKVGFNDVEFDLGNVSQFLNKSDGYAAVVPGWDLNLVKSAFGSDLTGVSVILASTTSTTPAETRTAWLTSSDPDPVYEVTASSWQANLWSTINSLGSRPGIYLVPPVGTNSYSIDPVNGSYHLASYDQIVSDGGVHLTSLSQLGGKVPFTAEGVIPAVLQFWAIQPSTDLPKPESTLVGKFTFTSDGLLVFGVGTVAPPSITTQPVSQSALSGASVSFSATVSGGALFYQWQKDGVNLIDGASLSGTASPTLNLTNVSSADSGAYTLVVTNISGAVTSVVATLTLVEPASITFQPSNLIVPTGSNATFIVVAEGTFPLRYLWRLNGVKIANATSSAFTLNNVQPAATNQAYSVVVSNAYGSVTSVVARVTTVGKSPSITRQPAALTKTQGQVAVFSVAAAGLAPLSYQWKYNGDAISGATGSAYTNSAVQLGDVGSYSVVITNIFGSLTSSAAVLTVNSDVKVPTISIAAPTANSTLFNGNVTLTGSAADDARVSQVLVSLNGGDTNIAWITNSSPTAAKWGIPLALVAGTNSVLVQSVDFAGNKSLPAKRSFFFGVPTPVTLNIVGSGSVTPTNLLSTNLYVGRSYTLTAVPAPNSLFTNWVNETEGTTTNTNKYTFVVKSNLVLTLNFATNRFLMVSGSYNGLFSDEVNGVNLSNAGFAGITITTPTSAPATFSGRLLLDGDTVTFSGKFDLQGVGTLTKLIDRSKLGKDPLTLQLQLPFDGSNTLIGTISPTNRAWTATLLTYRTPYNNTNNPATNYLGSYTAVIPGAVDAGVAPGGDGYVAVSVATNGSITAAGVLGDGTTLSQSIAVGPGGEWPLFSQLYLNAATKEYQGVILGWLAVDASNGVSGTVHWIKSGTATTSAYTNGFTNDVVVVGSPYTSSNAAVAWTAGLLSFQSVDGQSAFTNGVSFQPSPPKFAITQTNNLGTVKSLVLTPKTGLLTGTYKTNASGPVLTFKGVVLQKQNTGRGFFAITNETGAFLLNSLSD